MKMFLCTDRIVLGFKSTLWSNDNICRFLSTLKLNECINEGNCSRKKSATLVVVDSKVLELISCCKKDSNVVTQQNKPKMTLL